MAKETQVKNLDWKKQIKERKLEIYGLEKSARRFVRF